MSERGKMAGGCVLIWAITGALHAGPQIATATEGQYSSERQLQQKLALVERMLFESPLGEQATRLPSELPPPAYEAWLAASQAFERALAAMKNQNNNEADSLLNTALAHYRQASALKRQTSLPQKDFSLLLADIKARIQSYRESLDLIAQEKDTRQPQRMTQKEIDQTLVSAQNFAQQGDLEQAVRVLQSLQTALERELVMVRSGETLVSSIEFDNPQDAFEYELKKNKSNEKLLKLLLNKQSISKDKRVLVMNYLEQSREAGASAIEYREHGDIDTALQKLENATAIQIRAIRLLGVKM